MNSCWKDTHRYIFHTNKVKYTSTWSIHEVRNNQMVKEYWERVLRNTSKTFSRNFLRAVYPSQAQDKFKENKNPVFIIFLGFEDYDGLKADDRCHATVHKGLQTLVWISCTWESIQKKLVCRRIRDGPLEKFFGGEGNFRAAGIFFRHQIPCMNFF